MKALRALRLSPASLWLFFVRFPFRLVRCFLPLLRDNFDSTRLRVSNNQSIRLGEEVFSLCQYLFMKNCRWQEERWIAEKRQAEKSVGEKTARNTENYCPTKKYHATSIIEEH